MNPIPDSTSSTIGFIGAGRVARTLGPAWAAAGANIVGAHSRSPGSVAALTASIPGARPFDSAQSLADAADIVFLTIPDDAIGRVSESLDWRPGQAVVHCSAATELGALKSAADHGAHVGAFHPLQIFSDPETARSHLAGSFVAIEADPELSARLRHLALMLHCHPFALPPGARTRYHIAANYAASGLLALLAEAEDLWVQCGLSRNELLPALLPLAFGTLDSARRVGLAAAVSGPVSRADVEMLRRHRQELEGTGSDHSTLYVQVALRLIELARRSGRVSLARLDEMGRLIKEPVDGGSN